MALNDYPIDIRADYPERSSRGWAALTILSMKATEPPRPPALLPPAPRPPSQWLGDPTGRHSHRCWDGVQWTPRVADDGRIGEDPLDAPGSAPPG
jgi:hypothetical protein